MVVVVFESLNLFGKITDLKVGLGYFLLFLRYLGVQAIDHLAKLRVLQRELVRGLSPARIVGLFRVIGQDALISLIALDLLLELANLLICQVELTPQPSQFIRFLLELLLNAKQISHELFRLSLYDFFVTPES